MAIHTMTEGELNALMARHPDDADFLALRAELERAYDRLTDCWLVLDQIARTPGRLTDSVLAAEKILRQQKAPGWKD